MIRTEGPLFNQPELDDEVEIPAVEVAPERSFSLPFLSPPETEEPMVEPHEAAPPTVVEPQETYSPDVHDRIPPRLAFEKLTGIEQPEPMSLEQERKFEVKDDPSQAPASYSQADPASPWQQQSSSPAGPQAQRATMLKLGSQSNMPTVGVSNQATRPLQMYRKAIISGAVAGAVILCLILARLIFS